jgi:hypothetical protein
VRILLDLCRWEVVSPLTFSWLIIFRADNLACFGKARSTFEKMRQLAGVDQVASVVKAATLQPMAGRAERQATIRWTARRMRTLLAPTRRNFWESDKQTELVFCDDMGCHGSMGFGQDLSSKR